MTSFLIRVLVVDGLEREKLHKDFVCNNSRMDDFPNSKKGAVKQRVYRRKRSYFYSYLLTSSTLTHILVFNFKSCQVEKTGWLYTQL